jgi:hypothetical protein
MGIRILVRKIMMDYGILTRFYEQYKADRSFSQGDMVVGQDLDEFGDGVRNGIYILLSDKKVQENDFYSNYYDAACLTRGVVTICKLPEIRILRKYNVEQAIT